jgi:hypothetical protein
MADLWKDLWTPETVKGKKLAQIYDRYIVKMMMMMMI